MGMKRRLHLIMSATLIFLVSCYYDKEELLYPSSAVDCNAVNATFTSVKLIIAAKCATAGCHNAASSAGNCKRRLRCKYKST